MLMKSDINPFDSQETKPYKNDPRISVMTDLVDAYQRDDIDRYGSILQKNKDVLADPFIAENIDEVTWNMRMKGVLKMIAPYKRFTLAFIAKQLKISVMEVQDIVGFLIVDGKLKGKINQEKGTVEIASAYDAGRTQSMQEWTSAIGSLWKSILDEGDGFRTEESQILSSAAVSSVRFVGGGSGSGHGHGPNGYGKNKGGGKKMMTGFAARGR